MKKLVAFRYTSTSLLLLFLLSQLFVLSSCEEEPEPIDLGFDDTLNVRTYFTDTATVRVKLFQIDSISTAVNINTNRILVGKIQEQESIGTYDTKAFVKLSTSTPNEDLKNDTRQEAIFDSLVVFLQTDYTYGNTDNHQINIHKITQSFENRSYYQFDELPYEDRVVGIANYAALDTNNILRVRMDDNFGRELLAYGLSNTFASDSLFGLSFKGLAFVPSSTVNGVVGIAPIATATKLRMFFHYPNDTTTSSYDFNFSRAFTSIKNNLNNSPLAPLATNDIVNTQDVNNLGVVQAGTGISAIIEFPYIKDFVAKDKAIIQRAELRIPTLASALSLDFPAPTQLLFFYTKDNKFVYSSSGVAQVAYLEGSSNRTALSMSYSETGRSYPDISITNFINDLANKPSPAYDGFIIQPSANNISVNRVIFPTQENLNNLERIQLRIYYSIAE